MTTEPNPTAVLAHELRVALARMQTILVANSSLLSVPFTDAPEQSPWMRVEAALIRLSAAAGALSDAIPNTRVVTSAYVVPDSPKMLRETLCVAQTEIGASPWAELDLKQEHIARLQRLVDECDRHRPLGPDGKHGDRHTPTCGCDDRTVCPIHHTQLRWGQCAECGPDGDTA
jgi:hypothetical protein